MSALDTPPRIVPDLHWSARYLGRGREWMAPISKRWSARVEQYEHNQGYPWGASLDLDGHARYSGWGCTCSGAMESLRAALVDADKARRLTAPEAKAAAVLLDAWVIGGAA